MLLLGTEPIKRDACSQERNQAFTGITRWEAEILCTVEGSREGLRCCESSRAACGGIVGRCVEIESLSGQLMEVKGIMSMTNLKA